MADEQLRVLEHKIDELITLSGELNRENQLLKAKSLNWQHERQDLIDKNKLARSKLEATLQRLVDHGVNL